MLDKLIKDTILLLIDYLCISVDCFLDIQAGTDYYFNGTNTTLIKAGYQDNGTNISIQCKEKFDLFDDNDTLINDTGSTTIMTCELGKWHNVHFCKQSKIFFIPEEFVGTMYIKIASFVCPSVRTYILILMCL